MDSGIVWFFNFLYVNSKQKCSHSNLEKEYYLGSATGDYKCLDCGEVGFGKDWPEKERSKNDNEE
ncbi:hypothetical protein FD848_24005 [Escherichia coli]|nr:hypothetical protein [Escherichia coli]